MGWLIAYGIVAVVLAGLLEWLEPPRRHDFD